MRVALFGSGGEIPLQALRQLEMRHEILTVIRPELARGWRSWLRPASPDGFDAYVKKQRYRLLKIRSVSDPVLVDSLTELKPDLLCIATFPWILPERVLRLAPLGGINLHASLLPRHGGGTRGSGCHQDDRETGVTVHVAGKRADAGATLGQERFLLPRGYPVARLHEDTARVGALLLHQCASALEKGEIVTTPQDESLATLAPRINPGTPTIDFATWPVERVWHFLAGLHSQYREPLCDAGGTLADYDVVGFFEKETDKLAGTLEPTSEGWKLHCYRGIVQLSRAAQRGSKRNV